MLNSKARTLSYVFLFILCITAVFISYINRSYMIDDAYIFLEYARNLVSLGEWTFNGIDKTNGSTSILYTLLLAIGGIFGNHFLEWSVILTIVIWVMWSALSYYLLFELTKLRWLSFLGSMYIITIPFFPSTMGMESHLVIILQIIGLLFFSKQRYILMGLAFGLAVLARPDSIALVAIIGIYFIFFKKKEIPWKSIIYFLVVLVPWFVYSIINFGTIFPDTLSAKVGQTKSGFWPIGFGQGLFDQIKTYIQQAPIASLVLPCIVILGIVSIIIMIMYQKKYFQFSPIQGIILVYIIIYLFTYGVILAVPNYHWYYTEVIYYTLVFILSLVPNISFFGRKTSLLVMFMILLLINQNYQSNQVLRAKPLSSGHVMDYKIIGEWLNNNTPKGSTIGATEVGVIAWYSQRPVIDMLGLNNLELANYVKTRDVGYWLPKTEPNYILFNQPAWVWQKATPYQDWESVPWFRQAYIPIQTWALTGGKYVLYKKILSPNVAMEDQPSELPTVAFPIDYPKDQYILGVSKKWKNKIVNANGIEKLSIIKGINVVHDGNQTGFYKTNDDPNLILSLPKMITDPKKRYFLKITMKAVGPKGNTVPDTTGQLFIATKDKQTFGENSPISFRVLLDNKNHQYYVPLFNENKWLHVDDVTGLRFDPIESYGKIVVNSIEVATTD